MKLQKFSHWTNKLSGSFLKNPAVFLDSCFRRNDSSCVNDEYYGKEDCWEPSKRVLERPNPKGIKIILIAFFLSACVHTPPDLSNSISLRKEQKKVWKILLKVMKSYPLKTIDKQAGYIETKIIKGPKVWKPPHKTDKDFYGYSYKIRAQLSYDSPLSKVTIQKKAYKQEGFFAEKKAIPTDQLEEQVLLYEISREIELQNLKDKSDL